MHTVLLFMNLMHLVVDLKFSGRDSCLVVDTIFSSSGGFLIYPINSLADRFVIVDVVVVILFASFLLLI